jgi:hypothetical protein
MSGIGALGLGLFGGSGGGSSFAPIQEIDLTGLLTPQAPAEFSRPADPARLPPWDPNAPKTPADRLVRDALNSRFLIDRSLGGGAGSSVRDRNDRELFILHNAVNKLRAIAERAGSSTVSQQDRARLSERMDRGLKEIAAAAAATRLDGAIMLSGKRLISHTSETFQRTRAEYDSKVLATGPEDVLPVGFQGDRRFSLSVTEAGQTRTVPVDLSELGTTPRTFSAVTGLINTKLADAGFETRIVRVQTTRPAATTGGQAVTEHRLRIQMSTGESVRFEAAPSDGVSGLTVAGARTIAGAAQSGVVRLDLDSAASGATPVQSFSTDIAANGGGAGVRAMVRDADGNTFVVADATGRVGTVSPKASRDVVLQKIDSTGQVVWTRALGSAAPAQGFSLAIAADGRLAVGGAVDGRADSATTTTGEGRDSFVAVFDREGRDLWFHQQGARLADQVDHLAFAPDGTLFAQGRAVESIGGATGSGDADVYVQSFSATGSVNWTRMVGGVGLETPAGIVVDGGNPVIAWNGPGGPRLAMLDAAAGADLASGLDAASMGLGRITGVARAEDGRLVVTGEATSGVADQIRVIDPVDGALMLSTDTGGVAIRGLAVGQGQIALALGSGVTDTGAADLSRSVIRGLSLADGSQVFETQVSVSGTGPVHLSLEGDVSSSLSAMGLPQGDLLFGDTDRITDRTALRAGDHFFVRVNGTRETRIDIADGETFRTLSAKIGRALLRDGRSEVRSTQGRESLVITPSQGDRIELRAGSAGRDVLRQLGLDEGVAMPRGPAVGGTRSVSDPPPVIALDIPASLKLDTAANSKTALDSLDGVLRRIRLGYREISTDPTQVELRRTTSNRSNPQSAASIAAYNRQTAAAQDALRRLGVG